MYAAAPPPAATGAQCVLFLAFQGLRGKDLLSKSDPFATVSLNGVECGKTEVVSNLQSGAWSTSIRLRFEFEAQQMVQVRVWDFDKASSHDHLGSCSFLLGNLMGSPGQVLRVGLTSLSGSNKSGKVGSIVVRGEQCSGVEAGQLQLQLRGVNIEGKDWGGLRASDPYWILSRQTAPGQWLPVHKSEVVKKSANPSWALAQVRLDALCRGNDAERLKLSVWDYDDGSKDDIIGETEASVRDLMAAAKDGRRMVLLHPPTKSKYQSAAYLAKGSGAVLVSRAEVVPAPKEPTQELLDFIAGGLEMSLAVAIDFTGSNGDPRSASSLHYLGANNAYERAIRAIGNVLAPYDSDGQICTYGFGGVVAGQTSHCFHLNGRADPNVRGVEGVLAAYRQALASVPLSGPTFFAPLLEQVSKQAHNPEQSQNRQTYTVLLLITDGAICDMEQTVAKLVQGSKLPLSVVIVGVGSADFSSMENLDGDGVGGKLRATNGAVATRDVVQFVPFNRTAGTPESIARETLAEIPAQLCAYFRSQNIKPNPPLRAPSQLSEIDSLPVAAEVVALPPTAPVAAIAEDGRALLKQAYAF
jgi:hypothetical protein